MAGWPPVVEQRRGNLVRSELDTSEQLADTMLCLPITSEIPEATVDYICGVVKQELDDILRG